MYTCYIQSFKILASFRSWAGWFESYLVKKKTKTHFPVMWCNTKSYCVFCKSHQLADIQFADCNYNFIFSLCLLRDRWIPSWPMYQGYLPYRQTIFFFFICILRPIRIISLILSWVWAKTGEPRKDIWPLASRTWLVSHAWWDDVRFRALMISVLNHSAAWVNSEPFLITLRLHWLYKPYMWRIKRICVFEHSVMTNFYCACPAIQRGQGSGFLSKGSSWLTACMSEQRRFWRDCADAQARLNLRCSHRR